MTIIPLGPSSLTDSSDRPGDQGRAVPMSPYLVLLRAGFCLPPVLPRARCALTAPFHPYCRAPRGARRRYVFCATFLQVALTGRYPAHCPAEFGLSSHLRACDAAVGKPTAARSTERGRSSGSLRLFILHGEGSEPAGRPRRLAFLNGG